MTTALDKVLREYATTEAGLTLAAGQWGQAQDTGRIKAMRRDGVTFDWIETSTRLAGQTSITGAALIGSAGITGITPNGGSSGAAATLANMLTGIRDSVILKSPYNSTINTIQPPADYVPLTIKGFASGVSKLLSLQTSATEVAWFDNAANLTLSRSEAGNPVSVRILNSDNTSPASNAMILLSTGGSSGGDPYIQFTANTASWVLGQRNAGPNVFTISYSAALGTNDIMTLGTGGQASFYGSVSVAGNLGVTAVATFTAAPVFSSVTASQILAVNGSKALVSLSSTGTGSVVLSVSPTLVSPILNGTIGTALSFSSTVVTDGSGNLSTVGVTGSGVYVRATAPTIATSLNLSYATASTAAAFDASKNLVSVTNTGTGNNVLSASPTFTGTITAAAISAAGNLSVSRAQVGGSVQSITQNTDNGNTASHAISVVQVGGTSAGDPYQTFLIPGGTTWSHGTDSSDSQSYKVSRNPTLGTNDALVITPALLATFGGSVSCGGGNGTYFQPPRGTSHPSSPTQGFQYENTADGHYYRYNGSVWTQLA